jgi:hypothetical protein
VLQGKVVIVIGGALRERGVGTLRVLSRAALKCLTARHKTIFISMNFIFAEGAGEQEWVGRHGRKRG